MLSEILKTMLFAKYLLSFFLILNCMYEYGNVNKLSFVMNMSLVFPIIKSGLQQFLIN